MADVSNELLDLLQSRPNPKGVDQTLTQALAALNDTSTPPVFGVPVVSGVFADRMFVPFMGGHDIPPDRDYICHAEDKYVVHRGAISKVDITHCVYWAPGAAHDMHRTVFGDRLLVQSKMNLLAQVPSGTPYTALDDVVCPTPAVVAESLEGAYDVEDLRMALGNMGRAMSRMPAAEWTKLCEHHRRMEPPKAVARATALPSEARVVVAPQPIESPDALVNARLAAHRLPIVTPAPTLTRRDAPPTDVYVDDEGVMELHDATDLYVKPRTSPGYVTEIVRSVTDVLGFILDESVVIKMTLLEEERCLAKARGRPDDVATFVNVAVECMSLMIATSAMRRQPMVRRLNAKCASMFTLERVIGPPGVPSLLEYVSGCVAQIESADMPGRLNAVATNRLLRSRAKRAFASAGMVRAVTAVRDVAGLQISDQVPKPEAHRRRHEVATPRAVVQEQASNTRQVHAAVVLLAPESLRLLSASPVKGDITVRSEHSSHDSPHAPTAPQSQ